ncbi:MAG: glycosyltransferase [Caldilineaceae bacterium]|nr:glycosyltransferase [Caldilineaceae bacterium]
MTHPASPSLLSIVQSMVTQQNSQKLAQILVLGNETAIRGHALAENLYPKAVVHQCTLHESAAFFQSSQTRFDLIVLLETPLPQSADRTQTLVLNTTTASDDILLILNPQAVNLPADGSHWIELLSRFAAQGYGCDIQKEALFAEIPLLHLRRTLLTPAQIAAHLSLIARHFWQQVLIGQHNARQQDQLLISIASDAQALQDQAEQLARRIALLEEQTQMMGGDWERLRTTPGYAVMVALQKARARVAPPNSRRERTLEMTVGWARIAGEHGIPGLFRHLHGEVRWRSQVWISRFDSRKNYASRFVEIKHLPQRPPLTVHRMPVDIVVCVHNALEDVQRCLASVLHHTFEPYRLILIDDGSDLPTRDFLADFARRHSQAVLHRSETASGYTKAANRGMRISDGEYVVLLNSDTIVTEQWLERMIACAESDQQIGLVGPLSNTASWQSVPAILHGNDWAENALPASLDIDGWAHLLARHSGRIYPEMPFLNGFCLLVRRQLLTVIGHFDENAFGAGYGEENDFALRARKAGWKLALADDAYVYHAQSRSYSHERRRQLSAQAHTALLAKHKASVIEAGVDYCRNNWVLEGIRARAAVLAEREALNQQGRRLYGGKRVLFVLPINHPGGGGNVVIKEGLAMKQMGVDVHLFNLASCRPGFEQSYPDITLPIHYGEPEDLPSHLSDFDAVIATWCGSVHWIVQGLSADNQPRVGYYVQDYEPYFFPPNSKLFQMAVDSYTALPSMRPFTKTEWNRQEVLTKTGANCAVIGSSIDIDSFRPRPLGEEFPDCPLRVCALVRPNTYRRAPELTMRLLRRLSHRYANRVQITIFGVDPADPNFAPLPKDFDWQLAGVIDAPKVEALMAQTDIFTDFSEYQAMGLTALEAMACGAAVIVPHKGGAISFARHGENALIVDTSSEDACWESLVSLVENREMRHSLRRGAIHSVCNFPLERAALNILKTLFQPSQPAALSEGGLL